MMGLHRLITALITGLLSISAIAAETAAPCPSAPGAFSVANAVDLKNLTTAMNCSGEGVFDVTWVGFVRVREPIQVSGQKEVTITGGILNGSLPATIHAGNTTGIFNVSNNSMLTLRYLSLEAGYSEKGGAVSVTGSSELNAFGCTFAGNVATEGGAVFAEESKVNFDDNATFSDNSAARDGGAIYASRSEVDILGAIWFGNNSATASGGGIYASSTSVYTPGDVWFSRNSATDSGGALQIDNGSELEIFGTTLFEYNSANDGGAIGGMFGAIDLDGNVSFTDNSARGRGGAISCTSGNLKSAGNTIFARNSAADGGDQK